MTKNWVQSRPVAYLSGRSLNEINILETIYVLKRMAVACAAYDYLSNAASIPNVPQVSEEQNAFRLIFTHKFHLNPVSSSDRSHSSAMTALS